MVAHTTRARVAKPVSIPDPASIFTLLKITNGGEGPGPKVSVRGVYVTEEQAYAAAIHNLIFDLEDAEGAALPKLRAIARTKTMSLSDRLHSLLSSHCQPDADADRLHFVVKKTELFPHEELDMDALMDAPVMPYTYWDSTDDEQDYQPSDEEEEEEEEDDEDAMDLEPEVEGETDPAEGSASKLSEEAAEEVVGDGVC